MRLFWLDCLGRGAGGWGWGGGEGGRNMWLLLKGDRIFWDSRVSDSVK